MLRWAEFGGTLRRRARSIGRRLREARMFARAMASQHHPIVAQIVPIRRCNLACTYCNEFDAVSAPVPLAEMLRRIDLLAELGTTIITISGGEPTMHPDLDEI
ncbi:MAG TPA: radical SAM protein, partial [Candidatus Solibacter sp.]|nr:radical SAM protein [Candidatus Solibacter sp.]